MSDKQVTETDRAEGGAVSDKQVTETDRADAEQWLREGVIRAEADFFAVLVVIRQKWLVQEEQIKQFLVEIAEYDKADIESR